MKEEIREKWREEIKKWPEMDALGSADWWLSEFDSLLALKVEQIGKLKIKKINAQFGTTRMEGYNQGISDALKILKE